MRATLSDTYLGSVSISLALLLLPFSLPAQNQDDSGQAISVRVPFVGCATDGQTGPEPAPKGADKAVQIDPNAAQKLAYYKDKYNVGVLAPRGWYCYGTYGSSGSNLFVTPQPIKTGDLSSMTWGITGPGIQLREANGETSGRFEVAQWIARVFPSFKTFVQHVINEGLEPASDFPSGPYPSDKLTCKSDRMVEYQTPSHSKGLGTMSRLQAGDYPISGVAILQGQNPPSLLFLALRLPSGLNDLASPIIRGLEEQGKASATQKEVSQEQEVAPNDREQYRSSNDLRAHDINGFALDMTVQEVQAVAHHPLRSIGAGQYKVAVDNVDYDFGFSVLGHLYRIDLSQNLGNFVPDEHFARTLTEKLSRKFGPPQRNQLPGGPAAWEYFEQYRETGGPVINRTTVSLDAWIVGGWGQPILLNIKLMDFRIMRRDLAAANSGPRSHAEASTKF